MKVFITTSGIGSKLGQLTKYMNKAMIKIGKKPVISYIIDQYPNDVEFVISLGYQSSHIVQYLNLVYPYRKFTFVEVDKYDGPGSSQVYSMSKCKEYLQEPFIYNDCDTICDDLNIDMNFKCDFLCGYNLSYEYNSEHKDHSNYDTFDTVHGCYISKLYKRGTHDRPMFAYVGIMGIYDYEYFWNCVNDILKYVDPHSDFDVFFNYYLKKHPLCVHWVHGWTDTGTIDGIMKARKNCKDKLDILDKNNQAIFIIKNKVVKFFTDSKIVSNIIKRHNILGDLTHKIIKHTDNFFMYDFIDGTTAINDDMNKVKFAKMMEHFKSNGLWDNIQNVDINRYKKQYNAFYIDKAITRVNKFKKDYLINEDLDMIINGVRIPKEYTIEYMLNELKKLDEYNEALPTNWHGDFTLENIISNNDKYTLIDCRDNFGGTTLYGDKLYDWGKMNHNLTFNFSSACKGLYYIKEDGNKVDFSIMCDIETYKCREILKAFVENNGIRYDYIEFLSGLNWVTMSPLHPIGDLPLLLFYMGKLKMYESLIKLKVK